MFPGIGHTDIRPVFSRALRNHLLYLRANVPGCAKETVTAPGADGADQTVNVVRC